MDWFKKRWTRKDGKLKKVRDKMDFMVREETLEIERLQSLGAELMSQRETIQASLEMDCDIRALEMLKQEKEEIEDFSNNLRRRIELEREAYIVEKLAFKEMWREDMETLKVEEDLLHNRLRLEWEKSERLKKKIKDKINSVRQETEEERKNLRRAKETQMELLEKESVIVQTLERERNQKRDMVNSAMAAVESERRNLHRDLVGIERERMNVVNRSREQRLQFEDEKLQMMNDIERERQINQTEIERLAGEMQTLTENWQNEKASLREDIQRVKEHFRTERVEMNRQRGEELESNKMMNLKLREMIKEEMEREKSDMRVTYQVKLNQMEAENAEQKESMLNETMRLREQFQKEIDCLHEEKKQTKAHWLKKRAEVEEDVEKEREMIMEEHFRLEEQLQKLKREKDNKRIAREEQVEIELKSPEVDKTALQWAKLRVVKRKWWAIEKKVIQERKLELESEILSSQKQWQVDKLRLKGEKKVAEDQVKKGKIKRWFLSLMGCKK